MSIVIATALLWRRIRKNESGRFFPNLVRRAFVTRSIHVVKVKDGKDEFPTYVAMLAAQDATTRCKLNLISTTFV
ncbi:hypothetical protein MKW92_034873 [Papaver armeniacum]|nr:hypothetical protein MKW92_034873 [Papaver armeniacum]